MSERVTLRITMKLESDAIFGSGFSVPGGEDIAVCTDENGYPYLKGSTLKGLLRESMENLLVWTHKSGSNLTAVMGESDWNGITGERRVQLSDLTLADPPADAQSCRSIRTFTELEKGVVAKGTLRMASCIHRGLEFTGCAICDEQDAALIDESLRCIKWLGTLRNRGFGRVSFRTERVEAEKSATRLAGTGWIRYRLKTRLPVLMTDAARTTDNRIETKQYISGSAVRGAVIGALVERSPEWFKEHKKSLLGYGVRFLNAMPLPEGDTVLPSLKGFYEDKQGGGFCTVLRDGTLDPGLKRAGLGSFCRLEGNTIVYWDGKTEGVMRICRDVQGGRNSDTFQNRCLCKGQIFEGYIRVEDEALTEMLTEAMSGELWLGADRYEGYGLCSVEEMEMTDSPAFLRESPAVPAVEFYLAALSPVTMLDESGNCCGIDETVLAKELGVGRAEVTLCATTISEYDAYNRTWRSRCPRMRMYDLGSVFRIRCSEAPTAAAVRALEERGLGIRRGEGFGQMLVLPLERLEGITCKAAVEQEACEAQTQREAAARRRAKYAWVMDHSDEAAADDLSASQIGQIQALCEQAKFTGSDRALQDYLLKKIENGNAQERVKFQGLGEFVRQVLEQPIADTLREYSEQSVFEDSIEEKVDLLSLLFNFSRRNDRKGRGQS